MTAVITRPNTEEKLDILSRDAQYDLACACSRKDPAEHRHRDSDGKWIYPITLPNGGVFSGQARDVLDRIAATVGGAWWISDGACYLEKATSFTSKIGVALGGMTPPAPCSP